MRATRTAFASSTSSPCSSSPASAPLASVSSPHLTPHVALVITRVRSYGKQDTLGLAQADPGLGKPEARTLAPWQLPAAPDAEAGIHMRMM